MLRIRLRRVGKKGKPSYRIVVAEATAPRDGAYLEWIGNYDPMADPPAVSLKKDRAIQWLSQGAQPSDAVRRILDHDGILERKPEFRNGQSAETAVAASAPPATVAASAPPTTVAAAPVVAEEDPGESPDEGSENDQSQEAAPEESNDESPTGEQTDEARPE